MSAFKAFIRVVKSLNQGSTDFYFGPENIIEERYIIADSKDEVKNILLEKYPQFFQNGKVYERETKDNAQFFYVVIFPLYNHEVELVNEGSWTCSYCGHIHENRYISRPRTAKLFVNELFCKSDDDHCLNRYKADKFKGVAFPDNDNYITVDSLNYIYKCTQKSTGKSYIGKTRNAPFFRWWNHLTHSSSPFGLYLRTTKLSDWTFEVLEELPCDMNDSDIFEIESKYIIHFDSINNGFNSVISNRKVCLTTPKEQTI